jgi:hypothetical protein
MRDSENERIGTINEEKDQAFNDLFNVESFSRFQKNQDSHQFIPPIPSTMPAGGESHGRLQSKEVAIYNNLIQNLQNKYELIRKDRNRLLFNWQNEKKMLRQIDQLKATKQGNIHQEMSQVKEENQQLAMQLKNLENENAFLKSIIQEKTFQQHHGADNSSGEAATDRNSVLKEWISLSDSIEMKKALFLESPRAKPLKVPSTDDIGVHASVSPATTEEVQPESKNASASSVDGRRKPRLSFQGDREEEIDEVNRIGARDRAARYLRLSEHLDMTTSVPSSLPEDQLAVDTIPKPWTKPPAYLNYDEHDVGALDATRASKSQLNDENHFSNQSIDDNLNKSVGELALNEPSRFINPFKNRLSELLELVKEETNSYQEIRHQIQYRDKERDTGPHPAGPYASDSYKRRIG